jgi:multisubunit Na+/H+ antiporter MnhE subunit
MREIAAWWVVLAGVWVLTINTMQVAELVAAAVFAVPCAVAAFAARRAMDGAWRPRAGWLRWFRRLPWAAFTETAAVLPRRGPGKFEDFELPEEPAASSQARKAIATVAIGLTPGTLVARTDERRLVVHRLSPRRSPVPGEVAR